MCNDHSVLSNHTAWARDARGTLATFATFGNWEHDAWIDRPTLATTYARAGVELLCNSAAEVRLGGRETGYATLTVVGLDDPVLGKPDPGAALAQVSSGGMTIWALHGPGYIDTLPRAAFAAPSFVLAGHTHGGQIRVPGWTPYTPGGSGRFVAGWYRDTFAPLYVARGIGTVFM